MASQLSLPPLSPPAGEDRQALPTPSVRYRDGITAGAFSGVTFVAILSLPSLLTGLAYGGNTETGNDYWVVGLQDYLIASVVFLFWGLIFGLVIGTSATLVFGSLIEKIHAKSDQSRWLPLWLVLWIAAMIGGLVMLGLIGLAPSLFLMAPILIPCGALAGLIAAAVYMRKSKYVAHPWSIYFPNNLANTQTKQT
jgi:hypothetical protein